MVFTISKNNLGVKFTTNSLGKFISSNNLIEFTKENILLNEKKQANLEKEKEDKVFKQYLNTKDSFLEDILSNSLVVSTIDEEITGPKLIKKR